MAREAAGFDFSAEMRAFAEKSVAQARQAFDSFVTAAQQAAANAQSQAAAMQSGTREVSDLAVRFAEKNIASSFEFAQRLVQAKDVREVMALHADYVNAQVAALTDQAKELSRHAAKLGSPAAH